MMNKIESEDIIKSKDSINSNKNTKSKKDGIIKHLREEYTRPVRDPLWKHIYISPAMEQILCTGSFMKLMRIRQLGPAILVYPGSSHTRFNHSIGVFALAKRIIETLVLQDGCPDISLEGVKAFLCAALLHDTGHFPHAHSFKELPLVDHEVLSGRIIMGEEISKIIQNKVGTSAKMTAAIIDHAISVDPESSEGEEVAFFRNILSGVLDPDKLDYLNRDAYFCGVPYGIQDTDFVISQMFPIAEGIALREKGVSAIENVLFSKYLMYKTVYWHGDVRVATALIRKAVFLGLKSGAIKSEELYGLDDNKFLSRFEPENRKHSSEALIHDAEIPGLYTVVYEEDYNANNPLHRRMESLDGRVEIENETARYLAKKTGVLFEKEQMVIDVPPEISFEVELPVLRGDDIIPFIEAGSVFNKPVVDGFAQAIRKIRYIVPTKVAEAVSKKSVFEDNLNRFLADFR